MEEKSILTLMPNIPVAVIPTIFFGIIVSFFIGMIVFSLSKSGLTAFIVGLVLFFIMIFFRFMNLQARKYAFYQEKAEFYEGFLNIVQRTVNYNKVTDCILNKSVWDRLFGTGTIQLVTAGHTGGYGYHGRGSFGGGVVMQYIKNPDETYMKVQK